MRISCFCLQGCLDSQPSRCAQWPLFVVGNILSIVAVNVDERVRGSRALEPAMLFLNSLFVEVRKRHHCAVASVGCQPMLVAPLLQVFAKNLFTSVTSYGTFAAFEVLAIAQLCLQVCLPPRRSHTPVKSVSIVLKQIYQIQRVYHNVDAVPGPHVATLHSIAHCSAAKSRAVSRVENSTYDARRRRAGMHLSGPCLQIGIV